MKLILNTLDIIGKGSSSPRSVGSDFTPYRPSPAPAQLDGTLGGE